MKIYSVLLQIMNMSLQKCKYLGIANCKDNYLFYS